MVKKPNMTLVPEELARVTKQYAAKAGAEAVAMEKKNTRDKCLARAAKAEAKANEELAKVADGTKKKARAKTARWPTR